MTKAEREDLQRLIRQREKVQKKRARASRSRSAAVPTIRGIYGQTSFGSSVRPLSSLESIGRLTSWSAPMAQSTPSA